MCESGVEETLGAPVWVKGKSVFEKSEVSKSGLPKFGVSFIDVESVVNTGESGILGLDW